MTLPTSPAARPLAAPVFFRLEEDHPPNGALLGFWIYLMSDCLVFAALFAVYGVLGSSYAGGPTPATLFQLPTVALNTAMLLFSSLTFGFAALAGQRASRTGVMAWLAVTAAFGAAFLFLELREFAEFIRVGAGPDRSAFLSSFFTLVGTHGLHVAVGLIWIAVLLTQIGRFGLTEALQRRLGCLGLFWHFLDVIWIGVFSFVYLIGTLR